MTEKIAFPFNVQQTKLSDLISISSSDAGRPAKHPPSLKSYGGTSLYGLSRVSRSPVVRPDPNLLSRDAIKRCIPVQKLCQFTHPLSIQVEEGCRLVPGGTAGSSFLRTCGWGGVAQHPARAGQTVHEQHCPQHHLRGNSAGPMPVHAADDDQLAARHAAGHHRIHRLRQAGGIVAGGATDS